MLNELEGEVVVSDHFDLNAIRNNSDQLDELIYNLRMLKIDSLLPTSENDAEKFNPKKLTLKELAAIRAMLTERELAEAVSNRVRQILSESPSLDRQQSSRKQSYGKQSSRKHSGPTRQKRSYPWKQFIKKEAKYGSYAILIAGGIAFPPVFAGLAGLAVADWCWFKS